MKRVHESVDYIVHPETKALVNDVTRQLLRPSNNAHQFVPPVPLFPANSESRQATSEVNPASSASSSTHSSPRATSVSPVPMLHSTREFELSPGTVPMDPKMLALKMDQIMRFSTSSTPVPSSFISAFAQVRDTAGSKYTVYLVHVTYADKRWVVYRRYNDFKELHESLMKTNWSVTIQALPRKTLFSNYSREFLTKRLEELHRWLTTTLTTNALLQVDGVRRFLLKSLNVPPQGMAVPTFVTFPGQQANGIASLGNELVKTVSDVAPEIHAAAPQTMEDISPPAGSQFAGGQGNQQADVAAQALDSTEADGSSLESRSTPSSLSCSSSEDSQGHNENLRAYTNLPPQYPTPRISPRSPLSPNTGPLKEAGAATPSIEVPAGAMVGNHTHRPGAKGRRNPSLRERMQKGKGGQAEVSRLGSGILKVGLKDFEQIRVLGKGSFGKVVLAQQIQTGKHFAMKILKKDYVLQKKQVEHTKTERSVLSQMNHPFIVKLHYAFQTGDKLHFVLDFCPGGELFFHLGRAGRFNEELGCFYAAEISLALGHLHEKGVVYRDLKPENILFDETGHIKLADFGLSKEGIRSGTEGTHSFCGTPEYLAPEVLSRSGHGTSVDWWSLGALLFEMLTGLPPWYNQNRNKMFEAIQKSALRFPPFVSPVAQDVLSGFLQRNASLRLGSQNDVEEIKLHPFFARIDWIALYNREVTPPFKPKVQNKLDTSNFENTFTRLPLESVAQCDDIAELSRSRVESNPFDGFTFTDPSLVNSIAKGMGSLSLRRNSGLSLSLRRRSLAGSLSPATAMYAKGGQTTPRTEGGIPSSPVVTSTTPSPLHATGNDMLQFPFHTGANAPGNFAGSLTSPVNSGLMMADGGFGYSPSQNHAALMQEYSDIVEQGHDQLHASSLDDY